MLKGFLVFNYREIICNELEQFWPSWCMGKFGCKSWAFFMHSKIVQYGGRHGRMVNALARRPGGPRSESRRRRLEFLLQFQLLRGSSRNEEQKSIALSQNGWMDGCTRNQKYKINYAAVSAI